MPKPKAKSKKKKIRRRQSRPHLGLYILAAIVVILIMWLVIRNPHAAPGELEEKISTTIQAREQRRADRKVAVPDEDEHDAHETPIPAPTPREGETEVDLTIRLAAEKLGVPERVIRRRRPDGNVRFHIPIDRSQMDLTFANMIFKGELEQIDTKLIEGDERRSRQLLRFKALDSELFYEIDLYYDASVYRDRVVDKTVTIVVDDFGGISGSLLDGFFELDTAVTFAIFPDEPHSVATMQRASRQGRDTIIHVPMEPIGYPRINPGDNAILLQHNPTQISRILTGFINQLPDAIGINNHMGSLATTDPGLMQAVMNTLREHDLAFLDSRTSNVSVAYQVAQKSHIKAYRNDLFLDSPNISAATMEAKLKQIISLSHTKDNVIAITHCHNQEKLDYLKTFISRLKQAGFTIIPLSRVGEYRVPEIL